MVNFDFDTSASFYTCT